MSESTLHTRFSGHASLAAIGNYLGQLDLLAPIKESVRIKQKTIKYMPFDKLADTFILLLTGAHRMVEINTNRHSKYRSYLYAVAHSVRELSRQ